uniref:Uncharacterized protein n=1 Tax=Quercus lobata TaxID=97700 RepID=A0A7N2KQR5_QUELO
MGCWNYLFHSLNNKPSLLNKQIPWKGTSQNHSKSLLAQYISSPCLLCLPQLPYKTAFSFLFASKFTGLKQGVSFLHRMAIGFFISIFATLVAGFIEVKRKHVAAANGLIDSPKSTLPISVFWLVLQYSLHGISEAFMPIAYLEFFYYQAPESMRSSATALFWTANLASNYASTALVS